MAETASAESIDTSDPRNCLLSDNKKGEPSDISHSVIAESGGVASAACKPRAAALWRTAGSKRPASVKPLLARNHKLQAVAAKAGHGTAEVQGQPGCGLQPKAQNSTILTTSIHMQPNEVSNLQKPVLSRARFKDPYKAPRPAG